LIPSTQPPLCHGLGGERKERERERKKGSVHGTDSYELIHSTTDLLVLQQTPENSKLLKQEQQERRKGDAKSHYLLLPVTTTASMFLEPLDTVPSSFKQNKLRKFFSNPRSISMF
jgi:hypothetical protein